MRDYNSVVGSDIDDKVRHHKVAGMQKESASQIGSSVGEGHAPPTSASAAALQKESTSKTGPDVRVWNAGSTEVNGLYLRNDHFAGVVNYEDPQDEKLPGDHIGGYSFV